MPIQIVRNDITKIKCDAIVNAANHSLLGGGGVDGAIHRAAGRGLLMECMKLGGCKTGEAKITGAYQLPCRYVIHTVGPVWRGGMNGEKELLKSCYIESLRLAKEAKCESIAFPLISSGVYGYPKDQALRVAMDTISAFLVENDMLVYIVVFDKAAFTISEKLFADIQSYVDDHYVAAYDDSEIVKRRRMMQIQESSAKYMAPKSKEFMVSERSKEKTAWMEDIFSDFSMGLEDLLNQVDESFSQMLLRMIDEKGLTDAQCYKKANVDRKLFSKIRSDIHYRPKKVTVLAFAIALELTLEETKDMLMKAGFALSHSSKFDIIVEYFIKNGNYNIMEINETLFAFDQSLLGI